MPLNVAHWRVLLRSGVVLADTTPPGYLSGEEGDVTNATVAVTFNEAIVSALDDYVSGVTIKVNGVAATINSGTRQSGNLVVHYVIASAADANDEITWEYSDAGGDIADTSGNQLGDVSAQGVTNNVGTHLWFDNADDSMHALALLHL